jgi:general secretion pathway protein G
MNKVRQIKRNEGGFTLIELLVVIIILGILSGIVVFNVGGARANAQVKACQASADTLGTAFESYYAANNLVYPLASAAATGFYTGSEVNTALAIGTNKILRNPAPMVDDTATASGGYYFQVTIGAGGNGGAVTRLTSIIGYSARLTDATWGTGDALFVPSCRVDF